MHWDLKRKAILPNQCIFLNESISNLNVVKIYSRGIIGDLSTLTDVMDQRHHASSHYFKPCWPRSMTPYEVIRPRWVGVAFKTISYPAQWLQWRHNEHDGVSNHQPHDCLLNHLFGRRSKKTPKLRVTGLCEGNSPVTGEFPAQRASNAKNVSIWWRHHDSIDSLPWFK